MVAVSIIMPTYNQAEFVTKAIKSIIDQKFDDWELIIINNFSSDGTLDKIKEFNDLRIQVYNYKNNGIIAAARNLGINKAKGKYLAFLDSDDYWTPYKLSECKRFLEENNYDIVCHGEEWITLNGKSIRRMFYGPDKAAETFSLIFNRNALSTSAVFLKKNIIEDVRGFNTDPKYKMVEDYDLWIRLSVRNFKFGFIKKILGVYVVHNSTSRNALFKQMLSEINLLRFHFHDQRNIGGKFYYFYCIKRLSRLFMSFGLRYLKVLLEKNRLTK